MRADAVSDPQVLEVRALTKAVAVSLRSKSFAPLMRAATVGMGLSLAAPGVFAANYVVTNLHDTGPGSLRHAIEQANTNAEVDTITFASQVKGKIVLSSQLHIADAVAIEGPGAHKLTIEGKPDFPVFNVEATYAGSYRSPDLSLAGLRLTNAERGVLGQYFEYVGALNIKNCIITGMVGSAVSHASNVHVENSSIIGNGSAGIVGASASIEASTIANNRSVGVAAGAIYIDNSAISGNGGGLAVSSGERYPDGQSTSVAVRNSAITGNASGGVHSDYAWINLTVDNSTISQNGGHGIALREVVPRSGYNTGFSARVKASTISGNGGAGLSAMTGIFYDYDYPDTSEHAASQLALSNTTIVGNAGGGVNVAVGRDGTISGTIESSTIAFNTAQRGGGISVALAPDVRDAGNLPSEGLFVHNSIVARNSASVAGPDLFSDVPSFDFDVGYSLIQDTGGARLTSSLGMSTNIFRTDPRLARLQDLGGSTLVRAPEVGSPVIDRGNPYPISERSVDQRGTNYPRIAAGRQDMGAVEVQPTDRAPLFVQTLSDVNGNATPELAAVVRSLSTGAATLHVRDAQNGAAILSTSLTGTKPVLDLQVAPDMNGNGKQEVAVLREGPVNVELRDAGNGAAIKNVAFSTSLFPQSLSVLPDTNGNRTPELAVLGRQAGRNVVEVRDAQSGALLRSVTFDATATARNLAVLPDINGNGKPEVAALFDNTNPTLDDVLEVRDVNDGALVKSMSIGKGSQASEVALVADLNGNGSPELAVLRTEAADVQLFDSQTGIKLSSIALDSFYMPLHLAAVPDVNSNGTEEITVLSRKISDGSLRAEVRDAKTRRLIRTVNFSALYRPDDLAVISDINGNGVAELSHAGVNASGNARSTQKDAKTGIQVNTINY